MGCIVCLLKGNSTRARSDNLDSLPLRQGSRKGGGLHTHIYSRLCLWGRGTAFRSMASSSQLPADDGAGANLRARLAAFLPAMRAANEELERKRAADPTSIDMEHLADPDAQHIEMVRA